MNSAIEAPPRNPVEQLERANRAVAEQHVAGVKAMTEACGTEFKPPSDMTSAALIIRKLRAERDSLKNRIISGTEEAAHGANALAADVVAAIENKPLRDGSPLIPLAKTIDSLRSGMAKLQFASTQFVEGVKAAMIDRGMQEIPGMSGYFVGATPVLRAAEAAAIATHHANDRTAREGYLRARGWINSGNGWKTPPNHIHLGHLPFDSAVKAQVEKDSEPFRLQAAIFKPVDATAPGRHPIPAVPPTEPEESEL